jgi:hypothetical protein
MAEVVVVGRKPDLLLPVRNGGLAKPSLPDYFEKKLLPVLKADGFDY